MLGIAGAEQHDIDAGLVPDETIGGVRHRAGAAFMDQKAQRIPCFGEPVRDLTRCGKIAHRGPQTLGLRKDVAHREHQQRADAVGAGQRKDAVAGVLMHHVKPEHHLVPNPVLRRPLQNLVLGIVRCRLGDPKMAELAFRLLPQQHRRHIVERVVVGARGHPVQLIDIDVAGIELP